MKARFIVAWIIVIVMVGLMSHLVGPSVDEWAGAEAPAITTTAAAPNAPVIYRLPSK